MSKTETTCQFCGKTFLADNRELNRGNAKYCSVSCGAKAPRDSREPKYEVICKHCGQTFMSAMKTTKYCSSSCKQKSYRRSQRTENGTACIVSLRKMFENTPCEICGWNKASRDLHHVIPVSKGGQNLVENIISVCPNCHREIHSGIISDDDLYQITCKRGANEI